MKLKYLKSTQHDKWLAASKALNLGECLRNIIFHFDVWDVVDDIAETLDMDISESYDELVPPEA